MNRANACSLQVCCLDMKDAQFCFEQMPVSLQIPSLSPNFSVADAQRDTRLMPFHCGFAHGNQRWLINVHTLPFSVGKGVGLISPYGYGGPLTYNATPEFNRMAFAAWRLFCQQQGWLVEFIRCHPMAVESVEALGDLAKENRITVVVDLSVDDVMVQYNNSAKSKLRACTKAGVTVRWSQNPKDWKAYGEYYRGVMRALKVDSPYEFNDAYFEAIGKLSTAQLCICEQSGDQIAGDSGAWLSASVFLFGTETVEYHLSSSSNFGRSLGTAALAIHAAALRGQKQGAKWLYLGGGTDTSHDNPLLFFKRCFSKLTRTFYVAQVIHVPERYSELLAKAGYDNDNLPKRLIF
ncbi:MAG: hypothetical protein V1899_10735 [Planctomycetota bacterium]